MVNNEILYQNGSYHIKCHKGIPASAFSFLESISWGSEGAVYQNKKIEERMRTLHNPSLYAIYEGEDIRATAVFCQTHITVDDRSFNCFYIRYFASSPTIRGKGVMTHFSQKVMEVIREKATDKTIYFACFEKGNKRSYNVVVNAGYQDVGMIKTMGFSRFFPRKCSQIIQVKKAQERMEVLSLLKKQYAQHGLVQFNAIFQNDDYYIIRDGQDIVAGCQLHRVHWVINKMGGFSGKMIMHVVPLIPIINKLFNPKKFKFLAFEGIYVKPGYEDRLSELFEGLLAQENRKSAMIWMGATCPIRQSIYEKLDLGLVHSFVKDSDIRILASFKNMTKDEIDVLKKQPLYASAFDFT